LGEENRKVEPANCPLTRRFAYLMARAPCGGPQSVPPADVVDVRNWHRSRHFTDIWDQTPWHRIVFRITRDVRSCRSRSVVELRQIGTRTQELLGALEVIAQGGPAFSSLNVIEPLLVATTKLVLSWKVGGSDFCYHGGQAWPIMERRSRSNWHAR
jgi:hypothetical protein